MHRKPSLILSFFIMALGSRAVGQLDRSSLTAVREYVETPPVLTQPFAIPLNLHFTPVYRELVESMATESPTFRRQLLRMAAEARVSVDLQIAPATHLRGARAQTRIVSRSGWTIAHIRVSTLEDVVALIAHELEHVIERMDGVDLAAFAEWRASGVHAVATHRASFETVRAIRVGENVAREVRAAQLRQRDR